VSPFKRQERAAAKQRARGSHAKPGGPVYPLLLNPNAPAAEVPPELAERDYEFPPVQLPASRPLVDHTQLLAALDDDEPTQPLPKVGKVLDEAPQPAQHEGLAPAAAPSIPVPANPFLNAAAPQSTQVVVRQGNALPARLTDVELAMLGRTARLDTPQAPSLPAPLRRDAAHPYRFDAFDAEFWEQVETTVRQQSAGPGGLRMSTDAAMDALDAHLAAVDAAHREQVERGTGMEYAVWLASQLADVERPLPRRVPGASLAIEASRGQLVDA